MKTLKLTRIYGGKYQTEDGRFTITKKKYVATWWLIEDNLGQLKGVCCDCDTLKDAREMIAEQIKEEQHATA